MRESYELYLPGMNAHCHEYRIRNVTLESSPQYS